MRAIWTKRLATAAAALVTSVLMSASPSHAASPSLPAVSVSYTTLSSACQDITFVGARGSGEPASNSTNSMGGPVFSTFSGFVNEARKSGLATRIGYHGLSVAEYPAVSVESTLYKSFPNSIDKGVQSLVTFVRVRVARCPNERIILSGYSQGAMVTHRAIALLPSSVRSRVANVMNFGDGDRIGVDSSVTDLGTAKKNTNSWGIGYIADRLLPIYRHQKYRMMTRTMASVTPGWNSKSFWTYCLAGDPVCDYPNSGAGALNVAQVRRGVATHSKQYLGKVSADLGAKLWSSSFSPFQITATAPSRGELASTYFWTMSTSATSPRWRAQGLPPGLTLAGGLVSGIPTRAGIFPVAISVTDAKGRLETLNTSLSIDGPVGPQLPSPGSPPAMAISTDVAGNANYASLSPSGAFSTCFDRYGGQDAQGNTSTAMVTFFRDGQKEVVGGCDYVWLHDYVGDTYRRDGDGVAKYNSAGILQWTYAGSAYTYAVSADGSRIAVFDDGYNYDDDSPFNLVLLDGRTGTVLWTQPLWSPNQTVTAVTSTSVIVTDQAGTASWFGLASGEGLYQGGNRSSFGARHAAANGVFGLQDSDDADYCSTVTATMTSPTQTWSTQVAGPGGNSGCSPFVFPFSSGEYVMNQVSGPEPVLQVALLSLSGQLIHTTTIPGLASVWSVDGNGDVLYSIDQVTASGFLDTWFYMTPDGSSTTVFSRATVGDDPKVSARGGTIGFGQVWIVTGDPYGSDNVKSLAIPSAVGDYQSVVQWRP